MKESILAAAQDAFACRIKEGDVSAHTKNSSVVAAAWMEKCWQPCPDRIQTEVSVHPSLKQRIDVLDTQDMCAYEFKVSGKNADAEFYKDVVKVILWNETHESKIVQLVFITEDVWGRPRLDAAMPQAFIGYMLRQGLGIEIHYVHHES